MESNTGFDCLNYFFPLLPDSDNLAERKVNSVDLSNENSCNGLVQSSSVHVDGGSNWENETSYTTINSQVLFETVECDWESGRAEKKHGYCSGLQKYLEAVPRAVIQAWKSPLMNLYGFFLVVTKKMSGREMREWMARPERTVTMYMASILAVSARSWISRIFPMIKHKIPNGEYHMTVITSFMMTLSMMTKNWTMIWASSPSWDRLIPMAMQNTMTPEVCGN